MKIIFYILLFGFFTAQAQFSSAKIGVNGLTCSACSRSVEISLRKLPFVDSVQMDLKKTEALIFFKKGTKTDIEKLAKAVTDAGFSVRSMHAAYTFINANVSENTCISIAGNNYQFIKTPNKTLNGVVYLTFIGSKFMSKTDYNSWSNVLKNSCATDGKSVKSYFVTL
jgi:copper chaperone CopZ